MTASTGRLFKPWRLVLLALVALSVKASDVPPPPVTSSPAINQYATLAGVINRGAKKLMLTPEKAKIISKGLTEVVHLDELVLFLVLGWGIKPGAKLQYEALGLGQKGKNGQPREFEDSKLHLIVENVGQLAKLAFVIYLVDILKVILEGMGFRFLTWENAPHAFAKICYTAWLTNRVAALKRYLLARHTRQDYRDLEGQVQIVDRLIDAALYAIAIYVATDTVQTDMGAATKSVLAFGSVSTLVMSLAMQDIVAEVLHGLFLAGSNRINEGDSVEILGMSGKIESLGWLESTLRRSDNILVSVPNKDLSGQRISNLSRVETSQVKQTLKFQYSSGALEQIPALFEDIKKEVTNSCPALIRDGSKPLRVHMINYHGDHIEVVCIFHFQIKPVGDAYWDNRQEVLMAIGRAVQRSKLELALIPE